MRVPDEIRQCIAFVALQDRKPNSAETSIGFIGTAFFVAVRMEDEVIGRDDVNSLQMRIVYLVTARHVAERVEGKPFFVRMNTKNGRSTYVIGPPNTRWFYHPTDTSVDIGVIPYTPDLNVFEYKVIPQSMFLTNAIVVKANIGPGDEVFITGLFAHLAGSGRNIPIVRIGNVAMMPGEKVPTSIGSVDAYLIESRSIGGLSGSPVFVRQSMPDNSGSFYLMGLVHGHWDIPPESKNDILSDQFATVNMGIAIVIPATKLIEILNQPELKESRRRLLENKLQQKPKPTPDT